MPGERLCQRSKPRAVLNGAPYTQASRASIRHDASVASISTTVKWDIVRHLPGQASSTIMGHRKGSAPQARGRPSGAV